MLIEHRLLVRRGVPLAAFSVSSPHLAASAKTSPGDIVAILSVRIFGILVGLRFGLEAAALFFAAERIATPLRFQSDAIHLAYAPRLARHRHNPSRLQTTFTDSSRMMFATSAVVAAVVVVSAPLILRLMGETYRETFTLVLLLIATEIRHAVFGPVALTMTMTGHHALHSVVQVLSLLAIGALFVLTDGLVAATAGLAIVSWITSGVMAESLRRRAALVPGPLRVRALQ